MTDIKLEKAINRMLHGLQETKQRLQHQQELRNWSEISIPISLKDVLMRFSKEDLSKIRQRLEISGASQLKKGDLADLLSAKIPAMLEQICRNMDFEQYSLVKEIVRKGGSIASPMIESRQISFFREYGIIFTGTYKGEKILVVPEEIVNSPFFQEDDEQVLSVCRRNSEWIKLTQGLLYYYGTVDIDELDNLLNRYFEVPIRLADYLKIIRQASSYYGIISNDSKGYSHKRVNNPDKVTQEQQKRQKLEFYPFSKDQLIKAGEPGYVERNDIYNQFVQFLTRNYEIPRKKADEIVEECVFMTNNDVCPNQVMQFLSKTLEFANIDDVRDCMDQAVIFMNNTRRWILKGYAPLELSSNKQQSLGTVPGQKENVVDFNTRRKIGRNDPCSCGSGKKFKVCCGR
ncbi:SEC-C metal-binding domain-containing protein [Neobacillus sp. SAB-20_R2A]|uniref:YecA family protein n=1 Tax=Neobacillus sp. SAB-20_R2A TaxID=3120519 RepID=UPI003C6DFA62